MKKPKYSVTIREIYPYNFNRISNCEEVWYLGLEFTSAVLKAYNSYLLKKAKDYFAATTDCVETEQTKKET